LTHSTWHTFFQGDSAKWLFSANIGRLLRFSDWEAKMCVP